MTSPRLPGRHVSSLTEVYDGRKTDPDAAEEPGKFGGVNPADQPFSRRQFAAQVGGYALAAGGAVAGGLLLRDRLGHGGGQAAAAGAAQGLFGQAGRRQAQPGRRPLPPRPCRGPRRPRTKSSRPARSRPSRWSRPRSTPWGASATSSRRATSSSSSRTSPSTRTPTWPPRPSPTRSRP